MQNPILIGARADRGFRTPLRSELLVDLILDCLRNLI
jgi:hypothetical protein